MSRDVWLTSEYASEASRVQGPFTKTGHTHLRRLLIATTWHRRARDAPAKTIRACWELATPAARACGEARWDASPARRKWHVVSNVAVARELAAGAGSLAVLED